MTTFVIVHGAWGGSYAFRHVRRRLQASGHRVFTVSLTGIGERSHLAHPMVDLGTHIQDLVNVVLYEGLHDIVLVGFSYGGFVVTGALPRISDRIAHLVYLDAYVPAHGDTALKLARGLDSPPASLDQQWFIPPATRSYDDPAEAEWMGARRSHQPLRTLSEPVSIPTPIEDYPFKLSYIKATEVPRTDMGDQALWNAAEKASDLEHFRQYFSAEAMWKAADHARDSSRWNYFEINTNHMVMCNRPAELSALLAQIGQANLNIDAPVLDDVCGSWRLLRFDIQAEPGGQISQPYGQLPSGRLMILPNQFMSAVITASADAKVSGQTDPLRQMVAYSGPFDWSSSTMTTKVDVAWQSDWVGSIQPREASIKDGNLVLQAKIVHKGETGKPLHATIVWAREH